MQLSNISLLQFRNFKQLDISSFQLFNLICGENGTGKTSILEAIYYLAHTKSFRTHLNKRITQLGAHSFSIIAQLNTGKEELQLGIERTQQGIHKIRCNAESIPSISTITQLLPIQIMSNLSYTMFSSGPQSRRKFLNWGLFHVKPQFFPLWKEFEFALKQRNSALKQKLAPAEVNHWSLELERTSLLIHQLRLEYFLEILPLVEEMLVHLLGINHNIKIDYYPGWNIERPLYDILESSYYRDQAMGYTQYGAHRADLNITVNNAPVQHFLSQGQQKLTAHALCLAQGQHLEQLTGKKSIYLIDDLPSELDNSKLQKITDILKDIQSQVFITCIDVQQVSFIKNSHNIKLTGNESICDPL